MGGDGGSIPKRDDLVRTRSKPEQVMFSRITTRECFAMKCNVIYTRNEFKVEPNFAKYCANLGYVLPQELNRQDFGIGTAPDLLKKHSDRFVFYVGNSLNNILVCGFQYQSDNRRDKVGCS